MVLYVALVLVGYPWLLGSLEGPMSTVRPVFIATPAFLAIESLVPRSSRTTHGMLIFFATALVVHTALFAAGYWMI